MIGSILTNRWIRCFAGSCWILILWSLVCPLPGISAEAFPSGHLEEPPEVDPRAPNNHLKFYTFENNNRQNELLGAEVALTHNFGVSRWTSANDVQFQFNCEAGVFSQFQESIDDFELVSSDFYVGFPVEIQSGNHGFRVSLYHLSSHLGDEFQERTGRERISFSHESFRGLYFYHPGERTRLYMGGEYALRMTPDEAGEGVLITGFERTLMDQWFLGGDFRSKERSDWDVSTSLRTGRYFGNRNFSLGLEFFDGPLPVGQFFNEDRTYVGITATFKG